MSRTRTRWLCSWLLSSCYFDYLLCYHIRRYYLLGSCPRQSNSFLIVQLIWPMKEPRNTLIKILKLNKYLKEKVWIPPNGKALLSRRSCLRWSSSIGKKKVSINNHIFKRSMAIKTIPPLAFLNINISPAQASKRRKQTQTSP